MADYYPLIARAVQGLADPSPAMREAVYGRARSALMDQLRSLDPPLSEDDIGREGDALDDAIARVEAGYAPAPQPEPHAPEPYAPEPYAPEPSEPEPYEPEPIEPEPARYDERWPEAQARPEPQGAERRGDHAWPEAEPALGAEPVLLAEARPDAGAPARSGFGAPLARKRGDEAQPSFEAEPEPEAPAEATQPPRKSGRNGLRGREAPAATARPKIDARAPGQKRGGGLRVALIGGVVAVVIGAIAVTAYSLREDPADLVAQAPATAVTTPVEDGKIAERIGGEAAPVVPATPATTTSTAPAAPPATVPAAGAEQGIAVAQRAVLYEEDPLNPQGQPRAAAGRVVWQLEPGGQGEPVVRATVEIPDPQLRLVMLVRRNLDPTLPASHTIDLSFESGALESRRVRDIGLLQLKDEETIRGAPIAGLPVPVRDNLFLIGLSNLPRDVDRNIELLGGRNWIDLPVRLASGQRAILSFEKGASGDRILDEAFQAWNGAVRTSGN